VAFVSEFERRRNASYATWCVCVCVCIYIYIYIYIYMYVYIYMYMYICIYIQQRPEFRAGLVRAACLSFISESKRCRARIRRGNCTYVGSRAGSFSFRGKIPWRAGEIREIYRFKNGISRNIMLQKSTHPYNTVYFPLKNAGYAYTHAWPHAGARIHTSRCTRRANQRCNSRLALRRVGRVYLWTLSRVSLNCNNPNRRDLRSEIKSHEMIHRSSLNARALTLVLTLGVNSELYGVRAFEIQFVRSFVQAPIIRDSARRSRPRPRG